MLDILELVHQSGFVYNDLKLDNFLLDVKVDSRQLITSNENFFKTLKVHLIDFGFATTYLDTKTHDHLEKKRLDLFRGNMEFSSINQMKFHSTSRRDDLISLFYLIVYMLKGGIIPGFGSRKNDSELYEDFELIYNIKKSKKTKKFCFENTADLADFKREIFGYHFKDTPDYERLRNMLITLRDSDSNVKSLGISSHSDTPSDY